MNRQALSRIGCIVGLLMTVAAASAQTPPSTLPLLSLTDGTIFPGVSEEIQIIEPWSRNMVEEVLKSDHILGVVTLRPGSTPNGQGWSEIFPVGTVCVIDDVSRLPDGRLFIVVRGVMTFRIRREETDRPYRLAHIDAVPETVAEGDRDTLRRLRLRIDELARQVDPVILPEMLDAERINALASYMDLDVFERQALLERDGIVGRAQAMVELLTMKLGTPTR